MIVATLNIRVQETKKKVGQISSDTGAKHMVDFEGFTEFVDKS